MLKKRIFSLVFIIIISTCYTIKTSNDEAITKKTNWELKPAQFPDKAYKLVDETNPISKPRNKSLLEDLQVLYEEDCLRRTIGIHIGIMLFVGIHAISSFSISTPEKRVIYNVPQNLNSSQALDFMNLNPYGYNNHQIDTLYKMLHQDENNPKQECQNWIYIENLHKEKSNLRKR